MEACTASVGSQMGINSQVQLAMFNNVLLNQCTNDTFLRLGPRLPLRFSHWSMCVMITEGYAFGCHLTAVAFLHLVPKASMSVSMGHQLFTQLQRCRKESGVSLLLGKIGGRGRKRRHFSLGCRFPVKTRR